MDHHITKVSCGWTHTAVVSDQGLAFTWGLGEFGALGHGDTLTKHSPAKVEWFSNSLLSIAQVSCGSRHTAFATSDGVLHTCGAGDAGQLGSGSRTTELLPKAITNGIEGKITQVSCGIFHTCVVTENGNVWIMGGNSFGQLGLGNKKGTTVPTKIKQLENIKIKKIACGHHTAAITQEGDLYVWGSGVFGESLVPQKVAIVGAKLTDVSVGGSFGVALDQTNKLWVWGANTAGELGVGDYEPRANPCLLDKLKSKSVVTVACGGSYAIALGINHSISTSSESVKQSEHVNSTFSQPATTSIETAALENANPSFALRRSEVSQSRNTNNISEESKDSALMPSRSSDMKGTENDRQQLTVGHQDPQVEIPSVSDLNTAEIFSSVSQRDPHQPVIFK
jgi:alpha-tubulin suppressor-like RCC1 family protein